MLASAAALEAGVEARNVCKEERCLTAVVKEVVMKPPRVRRLRVTERGKKALVFGVCVQ